MYIEGGMQNLGKSVLTKTGEIAVKHKNIDSNSIACYWY